MDGYGGEMKRVSLLSNGTQELTISNPDISSHQTH